MKRARYRDAIGADIIPSVAASLVADIFGVTTERVTADLRRRKRLSCAPTFAPTC